MTVRFRQLLKQLQAANKKMSGADPNSSDPLPRAAMDRLEARIRMGQESTAVLLVRTHAPTARTRCNNASCPGLHEQERVLAALWLLVADQSNAESVVAAGGVELLVDVIRLKRPQYAQAIHMAVGALFFVCRVRRARLGCAGRAPSLTLHGVRTDHRARCA